MKTERTFPGLRRARTALLAGALIAGTTLATVSFAGPAQAAGTGPCDIYASGGTPCVAAHSTTRALFGAYNGPLYQVRRSSDGANGSTASGAGGGTVGLTGGPPAAMAVSSAAQSAIVRAIGPG